MSTQLFESFVQMLLPGLYRQLHPSLLSGGLKGAAAANEAKALAAAAAALLTKEQSALIGTVFDPSNDDKGFNSRLPSSIRLFNAAIAAKLNRLASSSLFGQRLGVARKLLLDTAFAEDTSHRLKLHIVVDIKPPIATSLASLLIPEGTTTTAWTSGGTSACSVSGGGGGGELQRWTTALAVALREAENIGIASAAFAEGAFDEVVVNNNAGQEKDRTGSGSGVGIETMLDSKAEGGGVVHQQSEGQQLTRQQLQQQQQQQRGGALSPRSPSAYMQGNNVLIKTSSSQLQQHGGQGVGGVRRKDLLKQASQRFY